jgi:hypothetical protein
MVLLYGIGEIFLKAGIHSTIIIIDKSTIENG